MRMWPAGSRLPKSEIHGQHASRRLAVFSVSTVIALASAEVPADRRSCATALFAWAVEEGLLARNPAARLHRLRLGAGQVRRLLAAAEVASLRSAVLVGLLMLYGCRIGEVLGVDVADIQGPLGARRVWLLAKGRQRARLR